MTEAQFYFRGSFSLWWGPMASIFAKSLPDLVKGIRAHKKDERQFISTCLKEIKEELKDTDNDIKVEALRKLSYVSVSPQ